MKDIMHQAENTVNIVGKLLDVTFANGTLSDGRPYERATATIRTTQTFGGHEETSEVTVPFFATQFTKTGAPNPAFDSLQKMKQMNTAQNVGYDNADKVRISGANIRENTFVTRSGQLIDDWTLSASFINNTTMADIAAFRVEIFIMDMHDEIDRDGDTTGRLIIKSGIVQYGGKLDVVEFIVERPETVDYIQRNWNINDTLTAVGYIRQTSVEEKTSGADSGWGEDIPISTTRYVKELIITKGDDQGKEEDFAYDPTDIKKAFNVRKANIEQMQLNAKNGTTKKTTTDAPAASKYSWE